MSTGDLKNNLRKLQRLLQKVGYKEEVDYDGLSRGLGPAFLPIYNYVFTSYSHHLVLKLSDMDISLVGANDMRFVDLMYKAFRDVLDYNPVVQKTKFLQPGFSERKVIMCTDVIECIIKFHKNREPRKPKQIHRTTESITSMENPSNPATLGQTTLSAKRPLTAPKAKTSAKQAPNYSVYKPSLYATNQTSAFVHTVQEVPSLLTVDVDTSPDSRPPHVEVIRMTERNVRNQEIPNVQTRTETPDMGPLLKIQEKLEVLVKAVIGLEERQAAVEAMLAMQQQQEEEKRHVEDNQGFVTSGMQMQNLLARLVLLESRMGSVESKVTKNDRVRVVHGPTAEELEREEHNLYPDDNTIDRNVPVRDYSPIPVSSLCVPSISRDSPEVSDTSGNDQEPICASANVETNSDHDPAVSDLISQVVRENESVPSDASPPPPSLADDSDFPPFSTLNQERREQILRIQSLLAVTQEQLSN